MISEWYEFCKIITFQDEIIDFDLSSNTKNTYFNKIQKISAKELFQN